MYCFRLYFYNVFEKGGGVMEITVFQLITTGNLVFDAYFNLCFNIIAYVGLLAVIPALCIKLVIRS